MIKTELSDSNLLSNNKRSQFLKRLNSEFIDSFDVAFSSINKVVFKEIEALTVYRTSNKKERIVKDIKSLIQESNSLLDFVVFSKKIKKQYELSLLNDSPDGHLKLVRKGEMFWELADYELIKNNKAVHSTFRFLSNGLSKNETLKLLEIFKEILDEE